MDAFMVDQGYRWKASNYVKQMTPDICVMIRPMIMPPVTAGCLHIRWLLYVYSDSVAGTIFNYTGKPHEGKCVIAYEISRFEGPLNMRLWTLCATDDVTDMCDDVKSCMNQHVFPFVNSLDDVAAILSRLRANPTLNQAAPVRTLEWISRLEGR